MSVDIDFFAIKCGDFLFQSFGTRIADHLMNGKDVIGSRFKDTGIQKFIPFDVLKSFQSVTGGQKCEYADRQREYGYIFHTNQAP